MKPADKLFLVGLALFSVLTSFMFVYYGIGVIHGSALSRPEAIFAYVTVGYGLINIYLLSFAWRAREAWTVHGNKLIGFCFFGVFAFDRFKAGLQSINLVAIAVLAIVLVLNWLAVKQLVERP